MSPPPPPLLLLSPDLFSCPERSVRWRGKLRYCCCTPHPLLPHLRPNRSNLLFVNAALTPEPLGVGGIPPLSDCNTCSVWEKKKHKSCPHAASGRPPLGRGASSQTASDGRRRGGETKPSHEHADARVDGIKATVLAREEAQQVCRAQIKKKNVEIKL